ncbi:molybdate ABC transporter substrate-binding protein [Sphingomonas sp. ID0503]|uniref:molybdate ABC transporter substrate-binding protein n=1 Tax=Sphingomonas sp. ID0503 TaxID=3399691 RepID=UPI003AFA4A85
MKGLVALLALLAAPVHAGEVKVAVAANFTEPAKEIAAAYEKASGDRVTLSFGSSGAFATQIANGAPFEVFLSADAERPAVLAMGGQGVAGNRFTYATGRLALYSTKAVLAASPSALAKGAYAKLSIADPKAAPYGQAAVETLKALRLYDAAAPKIVRGASIAQAYQFVASGAADLGFVALSQIVTVPGGSRWIVPEKYHSPITQDAILLKTGVANPAATGFLRFLKSARAKAIINRYGYKIG